MAATGVMFYTLQTKKNVSLIRCTPVAAILNGNDYAFRCYE